MMALRPLSGPRLPPARGSATHLVVLLHGYGADGNDLIGLAPHWQRMLPTVAFVAPNAPERCAGSPTGYQWFPISRLDPQEMRRGVESAADASERVSRFRTQAARTAGRPAGAGGLQPGHDDVAAGRAFRAPSSRPASSASPACSRVDAPALGTDAPPILLIHGDADPMIPAPALFEAAAAARQGGCGGAVAHLVRGRPFHRRGRTGAGRTVSDDGIPRDAPPQHCGN